MWSLETYKELLEALRRGAFDVCFSWFGGLFPYEPSNVPIAIAAGRDAGVPSQVQRIEWRNPPLPELPLHAIEVQSAFVLRLCLRAGVAYPLHFVGSGIDVAALAPPSGERQFPLTPRRLVIGRVSRLIPEKDAYSFVLAVRPTVDALTKPSLDASRPAYDSVKFLLAGDGPARRDLELLAAKYDAGPEVLEFVGAINGNKELRDFLGRVDIFLYSTTCDTLGYVVLEAMAAMLPVIATKVCSMEDLIDPGVTGLLVEPLGGGSAGTGEWTITIPSAQRYADAVVDLATRPSAEVEAMGQKAAAVAAGGFTSGAYVDRHAELMEYMRWKAGTERGATEMPPQNITVELLVGFGGSERNVPFQVPLQSTLAGIEKVAADYCGHSFPTLAENARSTPAADVSASISDFNVCVKALAHELADARDRQIIQRLGSGRAVR
jgi:glycosyltransferase involved in cell wall biosynthesis